MGLADGTLSILDVSGTTPKELSSQGAHTAGIACVAFSPDGNRLATVGGDGALRVWTVGDDAALTPLSQVRRASGAEQQYRVLAAHDGVRSARTAGSSRRPGPTASFACGTFRLKSEVRGLRGHTDWVTAVAFSPDGRFIASVAAEKDNTLRVFELPALESASAAGGHMLAVNAVAVSPNGKFVATAATDQTIKVWDIATGKEVGTLIGNADTPFAIAFLGNDAVVMGGSLPTRDTGRLHFWGTTPPRLGKSVPTGEVYTVIPSSDGTKIGVWATRPAVGDNGEEQRVRAVRREGEPADVARGQGAERAVRDVHPRPEVGGRGRRQRHACGCGIWRRRSAWAATGRCSSGASRTWA